MKRIKYSAEYISYVESGESAAVFVARDVIRSIDTSGKWIYIRDFDGDKNSKGRWDIRYFIFELYPRKRYPKYPKLSSDEDKKYITWCTANEDIEEQRIAGYTGDRFMVRSKLVYRSMGKNRKPKWDYDIISIKRLGSFHQHIQKHIQVVLSYK